MGVGRQAPRPWGPPSSPETRIPRGLGDQRVWGGRGEQEPSGVSLNDSHERQGPEPPSPAKGAASSNLGTQSTGSRSRDRPGVSAPPSGPQARIAAETGAHSSPLRGAGGGGGGRRPQAEPVGPPQASKHSLALILSGPALLEGSARPDARGPDRPPRGPRAGRPTPGGVWSWVPGPAPSHSGGAGPP